MSGRLSRSDNLHGYPRFRELERGEWTGTGLPQPVQTSSVPNASRVPDDLPDCHRSVTVGVHAHRNMKTVTVPRRGRVLVVEDERDVVELIRYHLATAGYDVVVAPTGTDALKLVREAQPDIVLLDLIVPHLNGWEVCRRLKQDPETREIPVIMVTGRVEEGDKVLGFEVGADDYVTKPFSPRELLARIQAVSRRGRPADTQDKKAQLKAGDLEIDGYRFEVRMKGKTVDLSRKEFELLAILVGSPGRVFRREELLDAVWGRDGFVAPRTIDVHITRLRGKFTAAKVSPPAVDTIRGVGYRFREARS